MDDFVLILYILVVAVISIVVLVVLTRYQLDLAISMMNKDIANKLKTFPATLSRSRGSNREPSNWEVLADLGKTFLELKKEGWSVQDILKEFGGSVVEETVKEATQSTKDS